MVVTNCPVRHFATRESVLQAQRNWLQIELKVQGGLQDVNGKCSFEDRT